MLKKDIAVLKKLLEQYRAHVLATGAHYDNTDLIRIANNMRKAVCDINDAEHIKKTRIGK